MKNYEPSTKADIQSINGYASCQIFLEGFKLTLAFFRVTLDFARVFIIRNERKDFLNLEESLVVILVLVIIKRKGVLRLDELLLLRSQGCLRLHTLRCGLCNLCSLRGTDCTRYCV